MHNLIWLEHHDIISYTFTFLQYSAALQSHLNLVWYFLNKPLPCWMVLLQHLVWIYFYLLLFFQKYTIPMTSSVILGHVSPLWLGVMLFYIYVFSVLIYHLPQQVLTCSLWSGSGDLWYINIYDNFGVDCGVDSGFFIRYNLSNFSWFYATYVECCLRLDIILR